MHKGINAAGSSITTVGSILMLLDKVDVAAEVTEQRLAKKNELKAKGTLLMALPDKHQLKFNIYKDAKSLMEAIKKRFGADLEEQSLDDLFNNLKIYEAEVKGSFPSGQNTKNIVFVSSNNTNSLNESVTAALSIFAASSKATVSTLLNVDSLIDAVIYSFFASQSNSPHIFAASSKATVSTLLNVDSLIDAVIYSFFASQSNSPQLDNEDLKQIDPVDLEETDLKWQIAMLTIRARRFLKRTRRNIGANGTDTIGFDMSKVECYNYHGRGHFARECRSPRDNRNKENTIRTSFQADEEPTNYALMAYALSGSSSSLGLDNEVAPFSKACSKAYATLQIHYDNLTIEFRKSQLDVLSYKTGLESVEARLVVYQKNEIVFEEDFKLLKLDAMLRDNALAELRKKFEKAKKERNDLKLTLDKSQNSSKNLSEGYHAVPPSYTGTFLPPKPDLVFTDDPNASESVANVFNVESSTNKPSKVMSKTLRPDAPIVEDWISDSEDETEIDSVPKQREPSFVTSTEPVQSFRELVKKVEHHKQAANLRINNQKSRDINKEYVAFGGNPKSRNISGKGKIKTGKLDFDDVYFVKELKFNLFSVSQMCDKKNIVLFINTECVVLSSDFKMPEENHILLRVPRENNMYNVDLKHVVPSGDLTCLFEKDTLDESNLWHRRIGHINFKTMNKLVKGNLVIGLPSKIFENNHACVACQKGKKHRASCKSKPVSSISQTLQRLHMDLFRPTFVKSPNKKSYCLVVTDENSRFSWVFFLATKDENSAILRNFITGIENQINHKVKIIRCNNGTEFKNQDLNQFCGMKRIKREFSVARTPQQNGVTKRKNKTLIEAARTMLKIHCYPFPFGADEGFLVRYSVNFKAFRVFNSRTRILQETMHINFLENKPNVAGIRPKWLFDIDTLTMSMNYQPVVVGNQPNDNAGIKENLNADDDVADVAFDVKENENDVYVSANGSDKSDNQKHDEKAKRDDKGKSPVDSSTGVRDFRAEFEEFSFNRTNRVNSVSAPVNVAGPNLTNSTNSFNTTSPSVNAVNMPEWEDIVYSDDEEDVGVEVDLSNLETNIPISHIPTTRVHKDHHDNQIIGDLNSAPRTRSMTKMVKEQGGLHQINDEDFCRKHINDDPVASGAQTCVEKLNTFEGKYETFITLNDYSQRLLRVTLRTTTYLLKVIVIQEHTQEEGIDYDEMDVKSAFVYGTIKEKVYVCQPLGFKDPGYPDKVNKMVKALYGLHQAPRAWYETLANYLLENGFQRGKIDQTLFIKRQKGDILLVQVYVDDIMFGSINKELCKAFEKLMNDKFQSDASEGSDQIVDFLNAHTIQYALVLRTLVDEKKVVVSEAIIRIDLHLDDVDGVECLPNDAIFKELVRMGYEKPPLKLTFYKAFFSAQWKFLIHTLVQCLSAKRTAWNEFSYSMASAVICLATGRKFNFSKYIFDSMVRNVDNPSMFFMYPRFLQAVLDHQVDDMTSHNTRYTSYALIHKVFANMRRVGKGFLGVETPLFAFMLVQPQLQAKEEVEIPIASSPPALQDPTPTAHVTPPQDQPSTPHDLPPQEQQTTTSESSMPLLTTLMEKCATLSQKVAELEQDKHSQTLEILQLKKRVKRLERKKKLKHAWFKRLRRVGKIEAIDVDEGITLVDVETNEEVFAMDAESQGRINQEEDNAASKGVSVAEPTLFDDEDVTMTMAQTLIKLKAEKAKLIDEQIAKKLHDKEVQKLRLGINKKKLIWKEP
nr:hypothetical protein [Tanacetum cinerariifolium]